MKVTLSREKTPDDPSWRRRLLRGRRSNTRGRRRRANYGRPNVSKPDYFAALIYLLNNHFASAAKSPSAPVSVMIKFGIGRRRVRYSVYTLVKPASSRRRRISCRPRGPINTVCGFIEILDQIDRRIAKERRRQQGRCNADNTDRQMASVNSN